MRCHSVRSNRYRRLIKLILEALIDETILYDVTNWLNRAIDALHCITDAQQKETADELVRLLEISDPTRNQIAPSTSNTQWEQTLASFDGLQYGESSSSNIAQLNKKSHRFPSRNDSSAMMDFSLLDDNAFTMLDTRYGSEASGAPPAHEIGRPSIPETVPQSVSKPLTLITGDSEQPVTTSRQNSIAPTDTASDFSNQQKRRRRRWADVARPYYCTWQTCEKSYGTMSHLNTHIRAQNHGEPKHLTDYPEVTEASSPRSMSASTSTSTLRSRATIVEAAADLQRSASPAKKRRGFQQDTLQESSRSNHEAATVLGKRPMLRPRNSDETDEEDLEVALSKGSLDLLLRAIKVVKVLKQSGEYV